MFEQQHADGKRLPMDLLSLTASILDINVSTLQPTEEKLKISERLYRYKLVRNTSHTICSRYAHDMLTLSLSLLLLNHERTDTDSLVRWFVGSRVDLWFCVSRAVLQLIEEPSLTILRALSTLLHRSNVEVAIKQYVYLLGQNESDTAFLSRVIAAEIDATSTMSRLVMLVVHDLS